MAHAMVWDREKCLAARMDGYVTKSIQTEELFAVIERLNEEGLWRGLHCQAPESDLFLDAQDSRETKQ